MKKSIPTLVAAICLSAAATTTQATNTFELDHTDRGSFQNPFSPITGGFKFTEGNYQVRAINTEILDGNIFGAPLEQERNYHTFDLSSLSGTITGATLRIYVPLDAGALYQSSDLSETINLFDVSTAASVLLDPDSDLSGAANNAYNDLGSGNSYGSFVVNSTDVDTYIDIDLTPNAFALADLNAAVGSGSWSVGGALVFNGSYGSSSSFISERVLGDGEDLVNGGLPAQLVLTGDNLVPEPSSLALLGLGGLIAMRRRR
ncbi:MAG: PEP-CTERM sorting domain-containing protein [Planctomycetota bacterium]